MAAGSTGRHHRSGPRRQAGSLSRCESEWDTMWEARGLRTVLKGRACGRGGHNIQPQGPCLPQSRRGGRSNIVASETAAQANCWETRSEAGVQQIGKVERVTERRSRALIQRHISVSSHLLTTCIYFSLTDSGLQGDMVSVSAISDRSTGPNSALELFTKLY